MIDPVVSIRIDEPEGHGQVRVQINGDDGIFFYLNEAARTELLRERIARICLSTLFEQHRDKLGKDPYIKHSDPVFVEYESPAKTGADK